MHSASPALFYLSSQKMNSCTYTTVQSERYNTDVANQHLKHPACQRQAGLCMILLGSPTCIGLEVVSILCASMRSLKAWKSTKDINKSSTSSIISLRRLSKTCIQTHNASNVQMLLGYLLQLQIWVSSGVSTDTRQPGKGDDGFYAMCIDLVMASHVSSDHRSAF